MQKWIFLDNSKKNKKPHSCAPFSNQGPANNKTAPVTLLPGRFFVFFCYVFTYLTAATSFLNVSGSFMARSASTFLSRPIPFCPSLWMKAE